ncbi:probable serine/threonine-protein kinase DDB_G0280133 [Diabrotica virgifera virgifera]|uniref:Uncharacterized protein n=1 Tax=Diabrotica virgifera virgifera TaxID=50390 RepID=A0ABM5JJX0_DIAVI|nr:probable serine/threonine-protein kinase DDB_G0280133 [Diabrotica virgifera virgifera]
MKIILLILLAICTILSAAEYPRYKGRPPPPRQRRVPTNQQFSKKWHQGGPLIQNLPQGIPQGFPQGMQGVPPGHGQFGLRGPPLRQRPVNHIPVLMVPNNVPQIKHHKIPQPNGLGHQLPQRQATLPVRSFWKNPVAPVKLQQEVVFKTPLPTPPPEKPFRSAPSIPTSQEFDYHIQTNQIPTAHINPIKQIGEKGPIHTIPAPNLSLKDKPLHIEEVRNDISFPHPSHHNAHLSTQVTIQKSHEYQVTEPPEHNQKLFRAQQEHQKQIQRQIQKQIQQMHQQTVQQELLNQQQQELHEHQQELHHQQQQELHNHQQQELHNQQQFLLATDQSSVHQTLEPNPQGDIILSNNLSPKDLYQLVSANYPQLQIPKATSNANVQLFSPDPGFLEQFPQESIQIASDKISFQPEYHSFNYDEQAHQKSLAKKDMSSLVSATYNLGGDKISSRNSVDPLAQAEIVQSYFDSRSDVADNNIEADAKSNTKKDIVDEKLIETTFYSSLPSKEAAERLAQLQTAGKVNSNLMKLSPTKKDTNEPLTIVISDEYEGEEETIKGSRKDESKEESRDYDEYSHEENIASEEFGHRIQPKKRAE